MVSSSAVSEGQARSSISVMTEIPEVVTGSGADNRHRVGYLTRNARIAGSEFPYLKSQFRLLREFRVLSPQQCAGPVKFAEEQPKKTSVVIEATSPPALPLPAPPTALPLAPPPVVMPDEPKNNKGGGNGGEGSEGTEETQNPGKHSGQSKH